MFGIEIPSRVIERIILVLALVCIVAFVMANRNSQNKTNNEGAVQLHSLGQRVDDQKSRLESIESKIDALDKVEPPPPVVENEAFTQNTYMAAGDEFSSMLK